LEEELKKWKQEGSVDFGSKGSEVDNRDVFAD
jgi:hypothetical protein